MQEQSKRIMLAAVIALGVLLAWNAIFPPQKPDVKPTAGSGSVAGLESDGAASAPSPVTLQSTVPSAPRSTEQLLAFSFTNFTATFSSYGGGIKSWKLGDARYERDASRGELIPQFEETSAAQVNFVNSTFALPLQQEWIGEKLRNDQVQYTLTTEKFQITKLFTLFPEQFAVNVDVRIAVKGGVSALQSQILTMSLFGYQNPKDDGGGGTSVKPRIWSSATYRNESIFVTPLKSLKASGRAEASFHWTGFEHPFMLVGLSPKVSSLAVEKHSYVVPATDGLMRTDVWFPITNLSADGDAAASAMLYLGPNYYDKLAETDKVAARSTHFNNVIDFGWFAFLGRPLLWLLTAIFGVFGNWGVAIILLTFVVKAATGYWTLKQLRGANLMRAIQPKLKEVQERYKGDVQRQRQEQMALNQQFGVNPFAGCLPGLLQMPVWLALYKMLSSAGETYLQPFIPGWIDDLTNTDPLHILPVLAAGLQILQMRLSPVTGTDPLQQKMMMYVMPVVFGAMSWFFPAGLSLYIFTNTALSVLMSLYINKYDKTNAAAVAKITAQIAAENSKTPAKNSIEELKKQAVVTSSDDTTSPSPSSKGGGNKGKKRRA